MSVYDKDGRVNIVGDSKAKYVLSIHLNSIQNENSQSGVEIYAPTKMNLKIAEAFAKNIVNYAKTSYSDLDATYKERNGVYVRTYRDWEMEESIENARNSGYEPYKITDDTPYLYMLRETGGIATGAFVDGRNTSYGINEYYNSNIGVEAYLLELGYLNNDKDRKKLINEQEGYIQGIVETVKEELIK